MVVAITAVITARTIELKLEVSSSVLDERAEYQRVENLNGSS